MRHPFALSAVLFVVVFLLSTAASPLVACPPSPLGLEALIARSEQAIMVEITDIDRSAVRRAEMLEWLVDTTSDVAGLVSEDLAFLLREELAVPAASAVAIGDVLDHLDADGPRVGRAFRWDVDTWTRGGVLPGRRGVLFLWRPEEAPETLVPIPAVDAILVVPEDEGLDELIEVVRAGYAARAHGAEATESWLRQAIRSPISRALLPVEPLAGRLPPTEVIDAIVDQPSGLWVDLAYLEQAGDIRHEGADLRVLELVDAWLTADAPYMARSAIEVALHRWGLPSDDLPDHHASAEVLERYWRQKVETAALPVVDAVDLARRVQRLKAFYEVSAAYWRDLERD